MIKRTPQSAARKVKYLIIPPIIFEIVLNPVPTLQVYSPPPQEQFAPGTGSVTSTDTA
jgi:hypothetical protein